MCVKQICIDQPTCSITYKGTYKLTCLNTCHTCHKQPTIVSFLCALLEVCKFVMFLHYWFKLGNLFKLGCDYDLFSL